MTANSCIDILPLFGLTVWHTQQALEASSVSLFILEQHKTFLPCSLLASDNMFCSILFAVMSTNQAGAFQRKLLLAQRQGLSYINDTYHNIYKVEAGNGQKTYQDSIHCFLAHVPKTAVSQKCDSSQGYLSI